MEKSKVIFGNKIDAKTYKKSCKKKNKFLKKYGDDTNKVYHLKASPIKELDELVKGVKQ